MSPKIIIDSEDLVTCPHCSKSFPVREGITQNTLEQREAEFQKTLDEQSNVLKDELSKSAKKEAERTYKSQLEDLNDKLENAQSELKRSEEKIEKTKVETAQKAKQEADLQIAELIEDLESKNKAIQEFRDNELALRKAKKQLEEEKENFELEQQRKLDEAKKELETKIREAESEKFKFKEDEYKKKIENITKANEELSRKVQQGSQQLQGEVLELAIENILRDSFPTDDIREVPKGEQGADVLQYVCGKNGHVCGTIIWEAKRTKNWSNNWIPKLKDDCLAQGADFAVLVTTAFPKGINEPFLRYEDVWLISHSVIKPVAETLRVLLFEVNSIKISNKGKSDKAELLYEYMCSSNFAQYIRSIVDTFTNMKIDLEKEKNAMRKIWKKREAQIERIAVGVSTMVGELQAISQDSLDELETIENLQLSDGSSDEIPDFEDI